MLSAATGNRHGTDYRGRPQSPQARASVAVASLHKNLSTAESAKSAEIRKSRSLCVLLWLRLSLNRRVAAGILPAVAGGIVPPYGNWLHRG
jgi:hypothetical protein